MDPLPPHWLSLVAVVFLLGVKHGFDPDHLAAIDGLTRFNAPERPRLARWSGLLFSLGHGVVVTSVAVVVATVATEWRAPGWLEGAGTWISITFLTLMGLANLAAAWRTPAGEMVRPVGLRTRLFSRLMRADHPAVVAAVGAAFALSFDTISQTIVFSMTGSHLLGWLFAALLGLVFTSGMVLIDAINGLWVSRLVRSADRRAVAAARVMSLAVGLVSIAIAGLAAARQASPALEARLEEAGLAVSLAIVASLLVAYAVASRVGGGAVAAGGERGTEAADDARV